jgi:SAM-dependent methyltransferase
MSKDEIAADRRVDGLYAQMRERYGGANPRANGYVYEGYFRGEQALLFELLDDNAAVLVDVACGSGLMVQPLIPRRRQVLGIDFNRDACVAARANGLDVVRGDAFRLPLADAAADEIVSCQFFNQQRPEAVARFVSECARVLRNDGQAVFVWRNGSAWVHRLALFALGTLERWRGAPVFPYENHGFTDIDAYAGAAGLVVAARYVSFPPLRWRSAAVTSLPARLIGASNICVLKKAT